MQKTKLICDVLWFILAVNITFQFKFGPRILQQANFLTSLQSGDYVESNGAIDILLGAFVLELW